MSNALLKNMLDNIQKNNLTNGNFLIGFSGGVDSSALLYLFYLLKKSYLPKITLRAIHVNHNINPEAQNWENHCINFTKELNIKCIVKNVFLNNNKNLESNARNLRYKVIQEEIYSNEIFVSAHHLDDQAETILLNIKRGAGLNGISGIKEISLNFDISIYRPLLNTPKLDLEVFLKEHLKSHIIDDSNFDTHYDRNFIRNIILPELNDRWPSYTKMLGRLSKNALNDLELLNELIKPYYQKCLFNSKPIISELLNLKLNLRNKIISRWLLNESQIIVNQKVLQEININMLLTPKDKNPSIKIQNKVIRKYKDHLYLTPIYAKINTKFNLNEEIEYSLPDNLGCIKLNSLGVINWIKDKNLKTFKIQNYSKKNLYSISFNSPRIKEQGKDISKDIKHIYQENNIPPWERGRVPKIFLNNECIGIVGI
ncbi:MAG: tRNA lysidine(34) synthetase TilS [Psittacicella sp.]